MKQDSTRYIVLKINVNEAENEAIRKSCADMRKSVSAAGRDLLLRLQPPAHRIRRGPRREGPRLGPSFADMFPARRGGAPVPLRL
jgi:hypothetical protein